jgi:hypothetical protein
MSVRNIVIVAAALCLAGPACTPTSLAIGCGDVPVFATEDDAGNRIELIITNHQLHKAPQWNGEGEPPLAIGAAIGRARALLSSGSAGLALREASLTRFGCGTEQHWYYLLEFVSSVGGILDYGNEKYVGVLLDGSVVLPKTSRKNP